MSSLYSFITSVRLTDRHKALAIALALGAMILTVCAISYFFLIHLSLRLDESQSLWQTSHTPLGIFNIVAQDVHVPLYHELLHFWRLFLGDSVVSSRLMSLALLILCIPATYLLGKQSYRSSIGLWAALLITLSPFMNWYGNEIRMYTLFTLLAILNQYFFIKLWKNPGRDTWFGYGITAVLGVFSHYFFFLNLAGQVVFYLLRSSIFPKGSFKKFVTAGVITLLCFAPWIWYVLHLGQIGNQTPTLSIPTTVDLFGVFEQFLIGFQTDAVSTVFLSLWPIALLFGFLALQRHKRMNPETEYLLLSVFVPIILAFGISLFVAPVFVGRYLIFTVPALYLCLLALFDSFPPRLALISRVGLVLLMVVMMGVEIVSPYTPVKEDYQVATDYISDHARPQDAVILSAPFTLYPVEYYYHGTAPLSTLPIWNQFDTGAIPPFHEDQLPQQVASSTQNVEDVWLLLSYNQGYEQNIKAYFDNHYQKLYSRTFSDDMTLYVYQIRYDAPVSNTKPSF